MRRTSKLGATHRKAIRSLLAISLLGVACPNAHSGSDPAEQENPSRDCGEIRPEMCAQIYDPVCARRDTGIRCVTTPCDSWETRQYPNSCEACRDPKVASYLPGPC